MMANLLLQVESPNVRYSDDFIESDYEYESTRCRRDEETGTIRVTPMKTGVTFKTQRQVPKVGVMLVGLGGNNGTTVAGAILANKHRMEWMRKDGKQTANYFGSLCLSSTVNIGQEETSGDDVYVPLNKVVPMADPNELIIDGWDISSTNVADAMERAKVIDYNLQVQLRPYLENLRPRQAIFNREFVAANQGERADNVIQTKSKWEQVEQVRSDIRDFKTRNSLGTVIVLWTANTERFTMVTKGIHDTSRNLLNAIKSDESEIAPSALYAVAAIMEGCTYINGSPQNTFVPGLIELAEEKKVFIGGDDFKSGQTKFKSVLVDFLVNAGIKPCSIVSYNHLGNNDGLNLSAPEQFRSKEISKSNVVDDMVLSNQILYGQGLSHPDHTVVIKYVPFVADSKRAMDEYESEIMLGGRNTIVVHNTCQDSLLAAPIILDLILLSELCQRVQFKIHQTSQRDGVYQRFNSVLSLLSYLCKAPLVERKNGRVVNSLFKQRSAIENVLRALVSLSPINNMDLRAKCSDAREWTAIAKPALFESQRVNKEEVDKLKSMRDGSILGKVHSALGSDIAA